MTVQCTASYSHTRLTALIPGLPRVSQYQKGKTNLDFIEARGSEWQWHQLGHMQVCTSLQAYNHTCTPPLSFLQAGCPSCRPTNSVKALKATTASYSTTKKLIISPMSSFEATYLPFLSSQSPQAIKSNKISSQSSLP